MEKPWDAVVIGSGIGGLAAAAALATCGKRVLVLERHGQAGGLTQTFERRGWRFNVGVHYLGGFGLGERVFHQKFGYGRVAAVEGNKLSVAFDKAGEKRVIDTFVERA